ncbi:MAG TPA: site-2 protease family protein, partial [Deinococcales bacterium]|nr:site-2 protease family protein [Deinococcales bacterium]
QDVRSALQRDGRHVFIVRRGDQELTLPFVWAPTLDGDGKRPLFGVQFASPRVEYDRQALLPALGQASSALLGAFPATVAAFGRGLVQTFSFSDPRRGNPDEQVVGPVGTVGAVGQFAAQGLAGLATIAALINVSLGIFNLFPIPGLDGGRILLSTIVAARRRPFRPGQEEFINFLGFAFVLVFIVLVTFRDIARLAG